MTTITKEEAQSRIQGLDPERQKKVLCALVGHSKIVTTCFGYVNCGRCGEQIGDTLGGASDLKKNVVIGHNCDTCVANYQPLGWKDKFLTPDPFAEKKT